MADVVQVHFEQPELSIVTYQNILIWNFRMHCTLAHMQRSELVHRDLVRRYPNGFAVMTVISDTVSMTIPPDARELAGNIVKTYTKHYLALTDVIEGTGIKQSITRGIMSGIRMFGKNTCPVKVFSTAEESARWLASHTKVDAEGIVAATVRARQKPIAPAALASNA
jgi:hypothetical protein